MYSPMTAHAHKGRMDRSEIIAGLKSGAVNLVFLDDQAKKCDVWKTFGIPQHNEKRFSMFASCKLCYYTVKVRDSSGRHLGTSNLRAHITKCPKRQVSQQKAIDQFCKRNQPRITSNEKQELKNLLVAHVVEGMHSFHSVEEDSLQALVQFGARMGQRHPGCNIPADDWIGRRTVARSVLDRYEQLEAKMREALEYPLQHACVALTTDMWTDNVRKRSYMDVSALYLSSAVATELSRIALACHVFPDVSHNAINIKTELHAVMAKYNVTHDVPITTDSASVVPARIMWRCTLCVLLSPLSYMLLWRHGSYSCGTWRPAAIDARYALTSNVHLALAGH